MEGRGEVGTKAPRITVHTECFWSGPAQPSPPPPPPRAHHQGDQAGGGRGAPMPQMK